MGGAEVFGFDDRSDALCSNQNAINHNLETIGAAVEKLDAQQQAQVAAKAQVALAEVLTEAQKTNALASQEAERARAAAAATVEVSVTGVQILAKLETWER